MKNFNFKSVVLLIVLSIIWGSSFILMKKGLLAYSASQVASLRILIAGSIFLPYIIKQFKTIPWHKFKFIFWFAVLEIGLPPYLYTFAQEHVDSSTAGILNSLVPLFTLFSGIILFKMRFNWLTAFGVFVGLLGAFIITFIKSGSSSVSILDFSNHWGLLIVIATLFYGIASNILKENLGDVSSMMITSLSFVTVAIPAGIYLFTTDFIYIPLSQAQNLHSLLAITILSVFGSALAMFLFNILVKLSNALFASFVTYLIPFVSLFWGWLDSENISLFHFSSLIVIFIGIYIANAGEKRIDKAQTN
jgi:drug/metabolite transporter (DMT)-like permease